MNALVGDESDLVMVSGGDGEPVEVMENWCDVIPFAKSSFWQHCF